MLIVEIALGIVLAFIILAFLPSILELGSVLIVVVVALVIIGLVGYYAFVEHSPIAILLAVFFVASIITEVGGFRNSSSRSNFEGKDSASLQPSEVKTSPMLERIRKFKKNIGIGTDSSER